MPSGLEDRGPRYTLTRRVPQQRAPDNPIQYLEMEDLHPSYYDISWSTSEFRQPVHDAV